MYFPSLLFTTDWQAIPFEDILELYQAVGWTSYTQNPAALKKAFEHSSYVLLSLSEHKVLGLCRSLSDEVAIHYLQDILVHPDAQGQGIGQALIEKVMQRFQQVRTHILLTDDRPQQRRFYQKQGFRGLKEVPQLNVYLQMQGLNSG